MDLDPSTVILGRYKIVRAVGEGGMGRVYLGHHLRLGFPVAVKVLTDNGLWGAERFELEAQLMAKVRHANVVQVQDFGLLESGPPCIVMEHLEGESLDDRLCRVGYLPWQVAAQIAVGMFSGLGAIHAASIMHRDLKPSNVFLVKGPPETVKLIDFGIARSLAPQAARLTRTGMMMGTPEYMAPEQLVNMGIDHRADFYAAGLIFYEMLAGMVPLAGDDFESLMRRVHTPIGPPLVPEEMPAVPDGVLDALLWALQIQPSKRPATAAELVARLTRAIAEGAVEKPKPGLDGSRKSAATLAYAAPPQERASAPALRRSRSTPAQPMEAVDVQEVPWQGSAAPLAKQVRFLVGARLPASVLARHDERRFLADLAAATARGFSYGAQFWFALERTASAESESALRVETVVRALRGRYGATARVLWRTVDEGFSLSAAALSGAVPLPGVLREMLDGLMVHDP